MYYRDYSTITAKALLKESDVDTQSPKTLEMNSERKGDEVSIPKHETQEEPFNKKRRQEKAAVPYQEP